MNLAEFSIRNHVFAWMVIFGFIFLGLLNVKKMKLSYLPDIDYPILQVGVQINGATPEEIEKSAVQYLESAFTGISGLKNISSSCKFGAGSITLEFDIKRSIDAYVQDVKIAIASVAKKLPSYLQPITIKKSNPESNPIMWLIAENPGIDRFHFLQQIQNEIVPKISKISGISEILLSGYQDPTILVLLKLDALKKYQLTASDVASSIMAGHSQMPGGSYLNGSREYPIYLKGQAEDLETLSNINILKRGTSQNYQPIFLKDVATLQKATKDLQTLTRSNGKPAIGIGIKKQVEANTIEITDAIKKWMPSSPLPLKIRSDSSIFIQESVAELKFTIIFSALLTAFLCWIFLGSWFATLNVTLAIPTSILGAFIFIAPLGYSLNTFTLLALSLAIGIIVDDAIMIIENIFRHLEMGKNSIKASLEGATQIMPAAIATTAAICVIFFPVFFMEGVIGKYFLQFGITLSIAIIISLIEALTLTPMRCAWYQTNKEKKSFFEKKLKKITIYYQKFLLIILKKPWIALGASFLFLISMLFAFKNLKKEYTPKQNVAQIVLKMQSLEQDSLTKMNQKAIQIEEILKTISEIDSLFTNVGYAPDGGIRSNTAQITLNLVDYKKRKKTSAQISKLIRKKLSNFKSLKITLQDISPANLDNNKTFPIEFSIFDYNLEKLRANTNMMIEFMEQTKKFTDIYSSLDIQTQEIQITPNRNYLQKINMPVHTIINDLHWYFSGDVVGYYSEGDIPVDIFLTMHPQDRENLNVIKKIFSLNQQNYTFPVDSLVKTQTAITSPTIYRQDRQRAVRVRANLTEKTSQENALKILEQKLTHHNISYQLGGNSKTFRTSFSNLSLAFFAGILLAYMILASQFNSFLRPLSVLIALPFAYAGAILGLYLTNNSLNIYSMIGMLLLMGIAKKNSILFVEFNLQLEHEGYPIHEALLHTAFQRLRPILITSCSTIVGALPAALSLGPGAESRSSMAIAIISGSLISTLFTLLVVPCCEYVIATATLSSKKLFSSFS